VFGPQGHHGLILPTAFEGFDGRSEIGFRRFPSAHLQPRRLFLSAKRNFQHPKHYSFRESLSWRNTRLRVDFQLSLLSLEKATSLNKMHAEAFLNRIQELGWEQVETACEIREDEFTEFE
jgi:hypothetical protein